MRCHRDRLRRQIKDIFLHLSFHLNWYHLLVSVDVLVKIDSQEPPQGLPSKSSDYKYNFESIFLLKWVIFISFS